MQTHKDLIVWKKSIDFVTSIYKATNTFPENEKYGITSQIRRAAVSIPSNIAEGSARKSGKEFVHFMYISLGSIAELETQLIISNNLGYGDFSKELQSLDEIRKMLSSLIKFNNEQNGS